MKVAKATSMGELTGYLVFCPGCGFKPSYLSRAPWGEKQEQRVCHSFVTDGRIQFLSDCTHELAGQTVDLPDDFEGYEGSDD
jgi:hypothetical protein